MRFQHYLERESVPEWRQKYLNYAKLKQLIHSIEVALTTHQAVDLHGMEGGVIDIPMSKSLEMSEPPHKLQHAMSWPVDHQDTLHHMTDGVEDGGTIDALDLGGTGVLPEPQLPPDFAKEMHLTATIKRIHREPKKRQLTEDDYAIMSLDDILQYRSPEESMFFGALDGQVQKINRFYKERRSEAEERFAAIKDQIRLIDLLSGMVDENQSAAARKRFSKLEEGLRLRKHDTFHIKVPTEANLVVQSGPKDVAEAKAKLKKVILEYYRYLGLVKNYQILNRTGIVKILKKYDRLAPFRASPKYMAKVDQMDFVTSKRIKEIEDELEEIWIQKYGKGDRRSLKKLKIPDYLHEPMYGVTFRSGFYLGISLIPFIVTIVDIARRSMVPNTAILLQIYAGFFIPILMAFMFGVDMVIYTRYQINYVFIFEFDPRDFLNPYQFMEISLTFMVLLMFCFFFTFTDWFPQWLWMPVLLMILCILVLINPLPMFYRSARFWFLRTIGRIVVSGALPVLFKDFFITDILTSVTYSFTAMQAFICAYAYDWEDMAVSCNISGSWFVALATMLPSFWRLMQTFRRYYDTGNFYPHGMNSFKYIFSIATIWTSTWSKMAGNWIARGVWIFFATLSASYSYGWDVWFDWGLMRWNSKNKLLRDELMYPSKALYWWAIVSNLFLRINWILLISPAQWGLVVDGRVIAFAFAVLEVYRRFQWCLFRMENEHLNNAGLFRASKDIPLPYKLSEGYHHNTVKSDHDSEHPALLSNTLSTLKASPNAFQTNSSPNFTVKPSSTVKANSILVSTDAGQHHVDLDTDIPLVTMHEPSSPMMDENIRTDDFD